MKMTTRQARLLPHTSAEFSMTGDLKIDVSACLADNVSVIFGKHKQERLTQRGCKRHVIPKYLQNRVKAFGCDGKTGCVNEQQLHESV